MTEQADNTTNLNEIMKQPKTEENPQQNQESSSDSNPLIEPQTHKKKKKKNHRKKIRRHSPEYYEQKRQLKLNKLREQNWNSHFINDAIPDALAKNKKKNHHLLSKENIKLTGTITKQESNQAIEGHKRKLSNNLPDIDKKHKTTKSFKIRVVNQSMNQKASKTNQFSDKKIQQPKKIEKPFLSTEKRISKRRQQEANVIKQLEQHKTKYTAQLNNIFTETKFLNCHKQMLEQFFPLIYNKGIRDMLDKQFNNLKDKKSVINKVMTSIQQRQNLLQKLISAETSELSLENVHNYRIWTIKCIEDILKWKQIWQTNYLTVFKSNINFDLVYKTQNYLVTVIKSTDLILSKPPLKKKQNQATESINPITNQNPSKIQNHNQSGQNAPHQGNHSVASQDPFLISVYGLNNETKENALKIRACELLLLQQAYQYRKK